MTPEKLLMIAGGLFLLTLIVGSVLASLSRSGVIAEPPRVEPVGYFPADRPCRTCEYYENLVRTDPWFACQHNQALMMHQMYGFDCGRRV